MRYGLKEEAEKLITLIRKVCKRDTEQKILKMQWEPLSWHFQILENQIFDTKHLTPGW